LTSPFGKRNTGIKGASKDHKGVDIAAPAGTSVYAIEDGVVTNAGSSGGYGNLIQLKSRDYISRYAHLSAVSVKAGERVRQGQVIGRVGSTGVSSGPHLHFELQSVTSGKEVDPSEHMSIPKKKGDAVKSIFELPTSSELIYIDGKYIRVKP
jgi:murein DD-endopeptidase MepM/ murein hydrolase activator NlpD